MAPGISTGTDAVRRLGVWLAAAGVLLAGCTAGSPDGVVSTAPSTTDAGTASGPPTAPTTPAPTPTGLPAGMTERVIFGDPWSTNPRRVHAIADSAVALARKARRGQTLTLSMFNMTYPGAAEAFIAAHRRGVDVRILLNGEGARSRQVRLLRAALGGNTKARSWVKTRAGGIRMHSKFLLLSKHGGQGPVVWVSSGNLTSSSGRDQANDAIVTTGDQPLYDFLLAQFQLMRKGVTNPTLLSRTATTPTASLRTFPQPKKGPANDPVLAVLNDIQCVHGDRRTTIRMAQLFLTDERIYVVQRLRDLVEQGCRLRIVGYLTVWSPDAQRALTAPGPGRVDLREGKGAAIHTKITTIDGWDAAGRPLLRAVIGSHNLTGRALSRTPDGVNDELMMQVWNPATVRSYSAWVDQVIARHSKPAGRG